MPHEEQYLRIHLSWEQEELLRANLGLYKLRRVEISKAVTDFGWLVKNQPLDEEKESALERRCNNNERLPRCSYCHSVALFKFCSRCGAPSQSL